MHNIDANLKGNRRQINILVKSIYLFNFFGLLLNLT